MIKNNIWNRIFHPKKVKEIREGIIKAKRIIDLSHILSEIEECKTLQELINVHKNAWVSGFQNKNLNVDPYGYIRSNSVQELTLDTLYLGGIWGLFTKPASFWETMKDESYGSNGFGLEESIPLYTLILKQYKGFLYSNCKEIIEVQISFLKEAKANNY